MNAKTTLITVAAPATAPQLRLDDLRPAHQDDADAQIARDRERAVNLRVRRVVATHRVENDFSRQPGFILRLSSHRRYSESG